MGTTDVPADSEMKVFLWQAYFPKKTDQAFSVHHHGFYYD
jgi:hypothetical protein